MHRENGQKLLARVKETLGDMAVVEQEPKQEGKTLCMIFAPKGLNEDVIRFISNKKNK